MLETRWYSNLKVVKYSDYIVRYGDINVLVMVVPLEGHSEVEGTCCVDCCCVLRVDCLMEVVEVLFGCHADAKVIDEEHEGGCLCFLSEEAVSFCFIIPVCLQTLFLVGC